MSESKPIGGQSKVPHTPVDHNPRKMISDSEQITHFILGKAMKGAKNDAKFLSAMNNDDLAATVTGRYSFSKGGRPIRTAASTMKHSGNYSPRGMTKSATHSNKKHH